jgi:hypothetical protein
MLQFIERELDLPLMHLIAYKKHIFEVVFRQIQKRSSVFQVLQCVFHVRGQHANTFQPVFDRIRLPFVHVLRTGDKMANRDDGLAEDIVAVCIGR